MFSDPVEHARYLASEQAAVDYCNEVVDGRGRLQYLDKVASVSAPTDDGQICIWPPQDTFDEHFRRKFHGSSSP